MFMRQAIKQGAMFQLDRIPNPSQQSTSNHNLRTQQSEQGEDERQFGVQEVLPPITFPEADFQRMAMSGNPAIVMCGAMICCLCAAVGVALFYYFVFDYVKPFLPEFVFDYVPFISRPGLLLSTLNAKSYFAQNQLIAGEFHYARVPVEYWPHRIEMIKSMGFNALSVYVFWNFHQVSKGVFDFSTQNKNLTHFLELAKIYDMKVLLRPGPYVCAEWDFGGLPPRFLNIKGLKIRSLNTPFLEQTKIYFTELSKIIKNYTITKSNPHGPILMIQVQNEPSWFTVDNQYIGALKKLWDQIQIGCPLYFDDIEDGYKDHIIYWENAILAVNPTNRFDLDLYQQYKKFDNFVFYGEVYSAWFNMWGTHKWQLQMIEKYYDGFMQQFEDLLSVNASFSMYLPFGGTNFGFTAGYNITTSYDYSAPISEQGRPRQNYWLFRSLITSASGVIPPKTPKPIPSMSTVLGQTSAIGSLFQTLPQPIVISNRENPLVFQSDQLSMYKQGMVLYETTLKGPFKYEFDIIVHDLALVYLDEKYQETLVREKMEKQIQKQVLKLKIYCQNPTCKLKILVQAFGHSNFGHQMSLDFKGIVKFVQKQNNTLAKPILREWKHYKFNMNQEPIWRNQGNCSKPPCLYFVEGNIQQAKDMYISLQGLKKGYVWVNGRNLGRYWDAGPQISLYCPGVWLTKGRNKILILDLYTANAKITVNASAKPVFIYKK